MPGESQGRGSLVGCHLWGRTESDTTELITHPFQRLAIPLEMFCITLWMKAQHEGALPPPCIVRKDPRVPHTARRGA